MGPPVDSIVQLIQELVRQPSRAGKDSYEPIFKVISDWLSKHGIAHDILNDEKDHPVGLTGAISGSDSGPTYLLDAAADTVSFGDPATWTHDPTSGHVEDGWLYGRGSADSKAGIGIFCHVIAELHKNPANLNGTLSFLFDAEEHSGLFTGIKRFLEKKTPPEKLDGVMIGYPGNDRIVVGSRGFSRASIRVHGQAAHSGSTERPGINAVEKAAHLVTAMSKFDLDVPISDDFPIGPKITVTGIEGGEGFSTVPDLCTVQVDMRLTPDFDAGQAESTLRKAVHHLDATHPSGRETTVEVWPGWPAFRLPPKSIVALALQEAAYRVLGQRLPLEVVGPSNIGNYLASLNVEATCGFGVTYQNIHGVDEKIEIDSIGFTYETYLESARLLLVSRSQLTEMMK